MKNPRSVKVNYTAFRLKSLYKGCASLRTHDLLAPSVQVQSKPYYQETYQHAQENNALNGENKRVHPPFLSK